MDSGLNVNEKESLSLYLQEADKILISINSLPVLYLQFLNSLPLPVKEMPDFKYLRSILTLNGQAKSEITTLITTARNLFFRLLKLLWNRREITIETKIRLHIPAIRSTLLYSCET